MRRIYELLGLASAQDVRDLQESTASAHERTTALADRLMALAAKVDDLVAAQRKSIDDLAQEVRENIDVSDIAGDVVEEAGNNFDISDYVDVYDLARDVKDEIDVRSLAEDVQDRVNLSDLVDSAKDAMLDQVKDAMREGGLAPLFAAVDLDKMVNQVIEREAPGIIGSILKHLDWNDELSIDVDVVKTTADIDVTVRSNR